MTPPDPRSTRHSGHHFNPLYRVAPYVQNVLDNLSRSNKVNLLHQRFKPAIKLGIQHWPRIVLDVMKECYESNKLDAGTAVVCGGLVLFATTVVSLSLFEVFSKAVLALRWDKPIQHAEFMLKYSRRFFYACGIASLISIALAWNNAGNGNDVSFGSEVWDYARDTARIGMELWALRTMLKDLKGEARTWWGGDKETRADPEKGQEEEHSTEELKHS
ncbi:hypothetical protein BGZ68_001228 [Mortierella alpina]|nr:hypothetical protein BGZ68_001228 [Mortierella alpina]